MFQRVYQTVQELVGRELSLFYKLMALRPEIPLFCNCVKAMEVR